MQGDGGTFRLRIATQKLELLTGTLIAGINSSYAAVVAGILYCAMLDASQWPFESQRCVFRVVAAQNETRTDAFAEHRHLTLRGSVGLPHLSTLTPA